jgi:hypothetical protein
MKEGVEDEDANAANTSPRKPLHNTEKYHKMENEKDPD